MQTITLESYNKVTVPEVTNGNLALCFDNKIFSISEIKIIMYDICFGES